LGGFYAWLEGVGRDIIIYGGFKHFVLESAYQVKLISDSYSYVGKIIEDMILTLTKSIISRLALIGAMIFFSQLGLSQPHPIYPESQFLPKFRNSSERNDISVFRAGDWISGSKDYLTLSPEGGLVLRAKKHPQYALLSTGIVGDYGIEFTIKNPPTAQILFEFGHDNESARSSASVIFSGTGGVEIKHAMGSVTKVAALIAGRWKILLLGNTLELSRNGNLVLRKVIGNSEPWIVISTELFRDEQPNQEFVRLDGFRLIGKNNKPSDFEIRQWDLRGGNERIITFVRHVSIPKHSKENPGLLPELHETIEGVVNKVLGPKGRLGIAGDPIILAHKHTFGGNNGPWVYIPSGTVNHSHTAAHEIAHWYGALRKNTSWEAEPWLFEGLADFLANVALNRLVGRPDWVFWSHFFSSKDWTSNNGVDCRLSEYSTIVRAGNENLRSTCLHQSYHKGHMYLWLLAEVVSWNKFLTFLEQSPGSGDGSSFLSDLQRFTGIPLERFRIGWLFSGDYNEYQPQDFSDQTRGGLLGFQKKIRGLDPSRIDSIKTGVSDLYLLIKSVNPQTTLPSLPSGEIFDGVPALPQTRFITSQAKNSGSHSWQSVSTHSTGRHIEIHGRRALIPPHPDLQIAYFIFNTSQGRAKVTFDDGGMSECEWVDNTAGRLLLDCGLITYKETTSGFEMLIDINIFEDASIREIYISRAGLPLGKWVESPFGTVTVGKISP